MLFGEFFFCCFECVVVLNLDVFVNFLSLVGFVGVLCYCKFIMSIRIIVDFMIWIEQLDEVVCIGELVFYLYNFGLLSIFFNVDYYKVYY